MISDKCKKEEKDLLVFGYGLTLILSFIATRLIFKHGISTACYVFYAVAAFMLIVTIFNKRILKAIYDKWMIGAHFIGNIISSLMLIILFYVMFAPVGIIMRIIRKDLLDRGIDKEKESYWIKHVSHVTDKEHYTRQF